MSRKEGACLVCGKPLKYFETQREMTCEECGGTFLSYASCEEGHYICDNCHSAKGIQSVMDYCLMSKSKNPVEMMQEMMNNPYIYMHGPEHHVMVGAALLTAYHNAGGDIDLPEALKEMEARGAEYPGGSCGFWGCCGAAVSTGMFLSIVTGTTPLSGKSWGKVNQITAGALDRIGGLGGPRCCKRNSLTAVIHAVEFVKENYGIQMELPEKVRCIHNQENKECIRKACPYWQQR